MHNDDPNGPRGPRRRIRRPLRGARRPWDLPTWVDSAESGRESHESRQGATAHPDFPLSAGPPAGSWPRAFDGAQPETPHRRRDDDPNAPNDPGRAPGSLMNRSRQLARKYRAPLVGLGMVGVALPLAESMDQQAANPEAQTAKGEGLIPDARVKEAERPVAATAGSQTSREDGVGQQWASMQRDNIITAAMETFGIDRFLAEKIHDIAEQEGIDPKLGYGLVKTESTFNTKAKSYVGALGLAQLMPRTAAWLKPGTTKSDLLKPEVNLQLGFKYLKQLQDKYRGNTKLALLAYNRGPGIVDGILRRGGNPDNGYAKKVVDGSKEVHTAGNQETRPG
jgi:hypothetical protein